ncbi:peptidoglycan-binding protein LysM [Algirhabdus cladophorae]|uniref:peptidoglycan-binding protein LysM n=1 Tax=Algirhabdus cladophorae TaxID=3377108 RepID=UPI003B847F7D
MGLWSFIKDAGKSIGIGKAEAAEAPSDAVYAEIKDLGLEADGVTVEVEGDTVKITGEAPSQEVREKIILAAGNIEGVGSVEETITAPDAKEPVFHTVEKGESLWKISAHYLGSGAKYMEIFEANKPMLSDPDKIYPGQNLRIPA